MCLADPKTEMLKQHKESWIDKLTYKQIKLQTFIERSRRTIDNFCFERDQKNFFRKAERGTENVGQIAGMEKFVRFSGDICEKDYTAPEMLWMEKMTKQLKEKIINVKEFNFTEESFDKEIKERKNSTAPRIDGITYFWWRRLKQIRRTLKRAFERVRNNKDLEA